MTKKRGVIMAIGFLVFFLMAYLIATGQIPAFDTSIREWVYSIRNPELTIVLKVITYMGNWQTITLLCIVLLCLPKTRFQYGIPVSISAIFITLLNKIIKMIFQRPRPDETFHLIQEGGYSFTSGHSITSMVVFGLLIYLVRKYIKDKKKADILAVLLGIPWIFIGLSRIYMGVHYPSDVLAGWALGAAILMIIISLVDQFQKKDERNL